MARHLRCPDHPDQELNYFCEECKDGLICPECVVHGLHKSHCVLTVARAYPLVVDRIEGTLKEIQAAEQRLDTAARQLQQAKDCAMDDWRGLKTRVASEFAVLRAVLEKKRGQMEDNIDKALREVVGRIQDQLQRLNSGLEKVRSVHEGLQDRVSNLFKV
ncbi:MAG: B-box zinc finger protein [Candidatus Pacebacteria bacterium]|nr:B-box zinc finger protein [Candidatus Paceibacterota bacterium]